MRKLPEDCVDLIYIDPPFNSNRNYESANLGFEANSGSLPNLPTFTFQLGKPGLAFGYVTGYGRFRFSEVQVGLVIGMLGAPCFFTE